MSSSTGSVCVCVWLGVRGAPPPRRPRSLPPPDAHVTAETVPVRPFRHDEYERFIPQAYPYYASVIALMAGFLLTALFFRNTQG